MKWKNFRFSLMKGNKRYLLFNGHRRAGREQRCCWTPAGQGWCKKLFQNQMGVTSIKYFIKLTVGLLNITSCRRSLMSLSAQTIPWFCEEQFSWPSISTMWFCNDFLIFEYVFCQTSPWVLWGIRESAKGLTWQTLRRYPSFGASSVNSHSPMDNKQGLMGSLKDFHAQLNFFYSFMCWHILTPLQQCP